MSAHSFGSQQRVSIWRASGNPRRRQQYIFAASVMIPLIASYLLFLIWPILWAFRISFTDWNLFTGEATFVGLKNYLRAFNDPIFRISLKNTFYYALLSVPSSIVLALALSVMIQASGKTRSIFRVLYFLPVITSEIATGVLWRWLFQPEYGLFNTLLRLLHPPPQDWLLSPDLAMPSVVIYAIWKGIGFTILIMMAGLDGIDRTFYEAAKVDGANAVQLFSSYHFASTQPNDDIYFGYRCNWVAAGVWTDLCNDTGTRWYIASHQNAGVDAVRNSIWQFSMALWNSDRIHFFCDHHGDHIDPVESTTPRLGVLTCESAHFFKFGLFA